MHFVNLGDESNEPFLPACLPCTVSSLRKSLNWPEMDTETRAKVAAMEKRHTSCRKIMGKKVEDE